MPITKIVNAQTGEEIEREMNDEELAQFEKDEAEAETKVLAALRAASLKAALLDRLGITEEEAKLLLS